MSKKKSFSEITGYELSRDWFDFCFENPELINPNPGALYFFIIEHCNRLGWKEKFGLPMQMAMDAIGIKNYRTYSKAFNDLINWGFIKLYQKSKNQYSANVIGLVKNTKANTKALSKAMQKHSQKQVHGIVGINKPITNKPITGEKIPTPLISPKNIPKEKKEVKKKKQPDALQYPFTSIKFLQIWNDLNSQPKWKKKGNSARQIALNQLGRYEEEFSIKLMERSIAGNYQGVVFSNTDDDYQKWLRNRNNNEQTESNFAARVAAASAAAQGSNS